MKKSRHTKGKPRFAPLLLKWNREKNTRQMPWKGEKDPYRVWLSEIILQQTRVEQGLDYYNRFIQSFPDIHQLAKAPEEKVFKLWEGLGYYSRCRNLLITAKYISEQLGGKFPESHDAIKALKGVGPYTAAAISSFAFDQPYAVVDGNVFRVLARIFGISKPSDTTEGKKYFTRLADELLDKKQPGQYNQAIMDFGATVCKPVAPLCSGCVFRKTCLAYLNERVNELPVKLKKIKIRKRWFYFLILQYGNQFLVHKRSSRDIWQGLYEFPLIEKAKETDEKIVLKDAMKQGWLNRSDKVIAVSSLYKQQLSHQLIQGRFITIRIKRKPVMGKEWLWVGKNKIPGYPFPQFVNQWLRSPGSI